MGIENTHKLIVNCLPLNESEKQAFAKAARNIPQEFVGDVAHRTDMVWPVSIPDELSAQATAVIGNFPVDEAPRFPRLEWLQTFSAGVDSYLKEGVLPRGTMVTNASGAYGQSVSEHMFALMWALMKNINQYAANHTAHRWQDQGSVLSPEGGIALVIGAGDIGSHFAQLAQGVGMRTFGVRRHADVPAKGIEKMYGFERLDALLPLADVVALAVPRSPQTHHLLDATRLARLKETAIVINAGRGDAIDPDALAVALHEGRIHGAGLDVTEPEPLPETSPLWDEPRCLITPHVAGGNHLEKTSEQIIRIALGNVTRYARHQELINLVRR
ncbi:phosphoglycerate dehydrogenase [Bifidobacterium saguini DSM 23967]|uniref:Phosphoglycerate dehydrogenase n=2 Tax=Bifidobacterium saguini TaxID=762210 RepID=A0A087DC03_9BIFI|nr:D-2-hydroxyacid dehydrogenase [Bifidobacterium saguini]KFI93053.1 phosphoglycerate dehydrogenase [Bifidobacterium saguini DSM 23967]QTB91316.1 D-2-hydroxyacid dehydrogenase [Bifidobacterium saguini]